MKLSILAVTALSAAGALAAGVISYEAVAPDAAESAAPTTADRKRSRAVTVFAKCPDDTVLRGKVCIRKEERIVTEYVAAPASVSAVAPQQATAPTGSSGGGDGSDDRDHVDDSPGDHPDDDDFDDHDDRDDDDRDDDDRDDDRDDDDRDDRDDD